MSARYKVIGPWTHDTTKTIGTPGTGYKTVCVIERATLQDTRTGDQFPEGAYRVTSHVEGVRTKTFKGETAFNDAARYADDMWVAVSFGDANLKEK